MSVLEAIANVRAPNIVGAVEQGRADVLARQQGQQELELNNLKLAAAKAPPKMSFKDALGEMEAKSQMQFKIADTLLNTPMDRRAEVAANLAPGLKDLSDDALDDIRAEAAYGLSASDEMGKAEEAARVAEAKGDREGAARIRENIQSKYAKKDAKVDRKELWRKDTGESVIVRETPDGQFLLNGRPISDADMQNYSMTRPTAEDKKRMSLPAKAALEKELASQQVERSQLKNIETQFDKNFLTVGGRVKNLIAGTLDYADLSSSEQKEFLSRREAFTMSVNQAFNSYRRWVTGAAAAQSELEMLRKAYIDAGNSPTVFWARLQELMRGLKRADEIKSKMLEEGLTRRSMGNKEFEEEVNARWAEPQSVDSQKPLTLEEHLELQELRKDGD